jgi:hypothetical protein
MIASLVEAEAVVSNREIGERLTKIEEGQKSNYSYLNSYWIIW